MFLRCKVTAWLSEQGSVWWNVYQIDIRRAMQSFSMIYYFNHHVSAQPYMMLSIDWSQGGIALCRWCCVRCWYRKVFRRPKWDSDSKSCLLVCIPSGLLSNHELQGWCFKDQAEAYFSVPLTWYEWSVEFHRCSHFHEIASIVFASVEVSILVRRHHTSSLGMLLGALPTIGCKESGRTAAQNIADATASSKMNDQ